MLNIRSVRHLAYRLHTDEDQLRKLADNISNYYSEKTIIRKGKSRNIVVVKKELDNIQKKILRLLYKHVPVSSAAYGWCPQKSSIENAAQHIGHRAKLCIDIKDCFNNIHSSRVRKIFEKKLHCSPQVATILTKLTTYNYSLPQGTATSGYLVNILLENLDRKLLRVTKELCYTRYGDDMTFSGDFISINKKNQIINIISSYNLKINYKKLQYTKGEKTIVITGAIPLKKHLIAPRSFMRRLRAARYQVHQAATSKRRIMERSISGRVTYLEQLKKFSELHLLSSMEH